MIYTKKQFIDRLKKMRKKQIDGKYVYLEYDGYNEAIRDILNMIEVEGECFRRE